MSTRVAAVVLHDVSPATWNLCVRLIDVVRSVGPDIPLTLLVVPDFHRRAPIDAHGAWRRFVDARLAQGDEVALHGLWHLDNGGPSKTWSAFFARRFLTAGEAEFSALTAAEARMRIDTGLEFFRRCSWTPVGFVPPAWQMSTAAQQVLREYPFRYTSVLRSIIRLTDGVHRPVPSLAFSARTRLRRYLSLQWNAHRLAKLSEAPSLRIALHPLDALYPDTLNAWRALLNRALRNRQPVTKQVLAMSYPDTTGLRHSRPTMPLREAISYTPSNPSDASNGMSSNTTR